MGPYYEELARAFAQVPVHVYEVYRTSLEAGRAYRGHVDRPTSKCALIIGLRGQAVFTFQKTQSYELEPGSVLVGGYRMELEIQVGYDGFDYFLVHYLPADPHTSEREILTSVSALQVSLDPGTLQLLDRLQYAATVPAYIEQLEKKTLFYQLLGKVLLDERHRQNNESYPIVEQAMEYIRRHYMEPLTLKRLATRFGMKEKNFSHIFRKYAGIGPIDYLIRFRMSRAHELLVSGQFPVSEVARSVGYSDAYYFSRLFKKHMGLPPSRVSLRERGK
ncbi:AraC family transcriptional regulator [Paenibacillus sp. M1]|uniref:AraC family transcriptional regulator n=1 Tax=Paenibacillus haidiansis TaxID=1574488 RepID=A0ABU7VKD5_9BACL